MMLSHASIAIWVRAIVSDTFGVALRDYRILQS
jgi:hypothetical protein